MNRPRSTRRTRSQVDEIRAGLFALLESENPMTVRQVFYRAVSEGLVEKTESEYRATVIRLLSELRRAGAMPFDWLADSTRWQRKPRTWNSLGDALRLTAETYRRALWSTANSYVEVWLEKDALAGVLFEETGTFDVPLMVTRGYPSLTFLHSAAAALSEQRRPVFLYYFGDWDPSGKDISRAIERDLRAFAPKAEISFERVAVNPEQIESMNLPTRPTKKTDSRSKKFRGESVEVDAIPPLTLRKLARQRIVSHLDVRELERLEVAEEAERETLRRFAESFGEAA